MTAAPGDIQQQPTVFGHPAGLFTLFFAEMWERFSFYGMRALLVFYMIKGFLSYQDASAYAVYGAYGALVYATPFIGGMLADRLLGARRAVVLGGLLMAAGHLLMTIEHGTMFFTALAFLIAGNGFFKPNISTIVGSLYPDGSVRRDGGFTLFYMGINLGAAMAPLLCGYIGETYGWHYGFGLATAGMLVGVAVFVAPIRLTQVLIGAGALGSAAGLLYFQNSVYTLAINLFVGVALLAAAAVALVALNRGGLPHWAGAPRHPEALRKKHFGIRADVWVYLSLIPAIPLLAVLVQGQAVTNIVRPVAEFLLGIFVLVGALETAHADRNIVTTALLGVLGLTALAVILFTAVKSEVVVRHRLFVVLILTFFSMLFWAFFEQAGSSVNNFTDRNVDRVIEARTLTEADVGQTVDIRLNQEQLGHASGSERITLDVLGKAREEGNDVVPWRVGAEHVGMGVEGSEVPASVFQAANPIFILLFGLLFSALWTFLGRRKLEPSTPVKFALGLLQLGLGFGVLWFGAQMADQRGMVAVSWLLLGYLLHTTGELCLSPVGLSMVTKLSPARIVSTVMGAWFLATAFSHLIAGAIAALTGVSGDGESAVIPPPIETVHVYGDVFGTIGLTAIGSAIICFALSPLLSKWMHPEVHADDLPAEEAPEGLHEKPKAATA